MVQTPVSKRPFTDTLTEELLAAPAKVIKPLELSALLNACSHHNCISAWLLGRTCTCLQAWPAFDSICFCFHRSHFALGTRSPHLSVIRHKTLSSLLSSTMCVMYVFRLVACSLFDRVCPRWRGLDARLTRHHDLEEIGQACGTNHSWR